MSYHGVYKIYTTLADFRDTIFSYVESAGWTLHDNIDANTRVYKTQGEAGLYAPLYMRLYFTGSTCEMSAFAYWNATTHAGTLKSTAFTSVTTIYGAGNLLAVSKDFFLLSNAALTVMTGCGFPEEVFHSVLTTTTGAITTGSSVNIPVVSSSGFKVGNSYQIHGVNYEGRDRLKVDAIPDSTHITVASVPRNYASGAFFGQLPFPAWTTNGWATLSFISSYNSSGITEVNVTFPMSAMLFYLGPDNFADDWPLGPVYMYNSVQGVVGYYNKGYLTIGPAATSKDTVGVSPDKLEQGQATSGANNTLTDTSKAWTTNQFTDKFLLIISGTGLGQSRKIVSNTGTIITLQDNWIVNPDATSVYRIADNFYRQTLSTYWFKITEDMA
jgi:hypothetical protein